MTRIAILKREDMNSAQGKVYDDVQQAGGPLGGPYWAYIRNPALMRLQQDLSNCIAAGGLSKRERQMSMLAIIRFWGAEYPWSVQEKAALAMGIAPEIVDAINSGGVPVLTDAREKVAYDLTVELLKAHRLSQSTYDAALKLFGEDALVSLVTNVGQFSMTCLTTIAFDCTPSADVPYRLKPQAGK